LKRIVVISIFLVVIAQLTGYRVYTKAELPYIANKSTASKQNTEVVDKEPTFAIEEVPFRSNLFRIEKGIYTHCSRNGLIDINIEYPQIICDDQSSMNDINKELYDEVITEDITDWQATRIDIKIMYEVILLNDNLFSVLFSGYYSPTGKYVDYKHAMTFDLGTKKLLDLDDFFSANEIESLLSSFNNVELCMIIPMEYYSNDNGMLKNQFLNAFKSETIHKNDFYIGENKIGLILLTPPLFQEYIIAEFKLEGMPIPEAYTN
jgi:hypothetical protein